MLGQKRIRHAIHCHQHSTAAPCRSCAKPLCILLSQRKGSKWLYLLNVKQNKMDGCFWSNKSGFAGSKREKKSNKNEINKYLVKVQPFSAIRSWMNHAYTDFLSCGWWVPKCYTSRYLRLTSGEAVSLHAQRPEVNQRFLCPHREVLQQIPHGTNTLVRLLVSSLASWSWTL